MSRPLIRPDAIKNIIKSLYVGMITTANSTTGDNSDYTAGYVDGFEAALRSLAVSIGMADELNIETPIIGRLEQE